MPSYERRLCKYSTGSGEGEETVTIIFVRKNGERVTVRAEVGENLLFLARKHGVEMEGACEASLACTTCHVYLDQQHYDDLEPPVEAEDDMLDLAPFLKSNSRLGCQIIISRSMDGMVVTLPPATRNFYVDGHTPAAH
ncbi:unnamed protein product [Soboliphyme baturini]|uniref:2Fe-2S ferredoxin-type domain-containing protein n=1 Tax=Soboliphyme baturini TaxID=241478 RepID=A0A183J282_9BILA|nr:unnamed protein product [Soboliphyme baturini]